LVRVPAVLMLAPPSCKAVVALTLAPWTVALVVMLLPVEMVPKPLAIDPALRAPVPVMALKVPAVRLALVILPLTTALPLYCRTSPLAMELIVRVVPCSLAMVGLG